MGECFKYVPELIDTFHDKIVIWLILTITSKDEGLIRNAVFCFGVMFDKRPAVMKQH